MFTYCVYIFSTSYSDDVDARCCCLLEVTDFFCRYFFRFCFIRHHQSLGKVDTILKYSNGNFLEGNDLTISDLELAVVTFHMMAAVETGAKDGW